MKNQPSTVEIIRCTLRNLQGDYCFMPGAAERIADQLDKDWFQQDQYAFGWVDEAERLISSEKLTLKKLEEHNVTIKTLVGWQMWMLFRDEMV